MPPAGYGFQQQLFPGIRPGVGPNMVMSFQFQRQGQAGQRMDLRRGGNTQQLQQQRMPRNSNNGFSRYMSNGRNGDPSVVPQALMGQMMPLPFDGSEIPASPSDAQRSGPVPRSTLASTLASANPETQRMMLGEQLFPLVKRLEHENAGKVTGMLLEMDQTEVLHLIESPDALKKKVAEALDVLRLATTTGSDLGDQLGSLNSE